MEEVLLAMLRGERVECDDWQALYDLAWNQGVAAVIWDVLEPRVNAGEVKMPQDLLLKWAGAALGFEQRYLRYTQAIAKLSSFYTSRGFRMLLLKGYGLSLNWPVPQHRPAGDIDIWLFGEYKKADAILAEEKGIRIDDSHHHHTTFGIDGFLVENHYEFQNLHAHKCNAAIEERLLATVEPCDEIELPLHRRNGDLRKVKVLLPAPQFNALFLISHTGAHFAGESVTLRMLLDWAYYVKAHGSEIDWKALQEDCRRWNRLRFLDAINAICVDYLGFTAADFPILTRDKALEDRILGDILHPEFSDEIPAGKGYFAAFLYRLRRWRANAWKNAIVYPEKPLPTFLRQVWAHLLKPASVKL